MIYIFYFFSLVIYIHINTYSNKVFMLKQYKLTRDIDSLKFFKNAEMEQ